MVLITISGFLEKTEPWHKKHNLRNSWLSLEKNISDSLLGILKNSIQNLLQNVKKYPADFTKSSLLAGYVLLSVSPVSNLVICCKKRDLEWYCISLWLPCYCPYPGIFLHLGLLSRSPKLRMSSTLWKLCSFSISTHLGQASAEGFFPLAHA